MIKLIGILNKLISEALPISKAKELYSIQKSDKVTQYKNTSYDSK